jgi:hypothetical protein
VIRYSFLSQLDPPAPFVNLVLRHPVGGAEVRDFPGQLDTAADRTVLHETVVKSLGLPQVGIIKLGGFGGATYTLPVFMVLLGVHDLPVRPFKVAAHPEESWALVGRDVLNAYRVMLDGPQLALEIDG